MKYLIVELMGCEVSIIFADVINHSDVAKAFGKVVAGGEVKLIGTGEEIPICGYCSNKIEASSRGKSVTAKVSSRPEDDKIIEQMIRMALQ